jgi:hypothetical protein
MPAILSEATTRGGWIPVSGTPSVVSLCLEPFDTVLMKKYPVSTRVNRQENDDHECAQEITVTANPMLSNFRVSGWETKAQESALFFHNSIHRYFVFIVLLALT